MFGYYRIKYTHRPFQIIFKATAELFNENYCNYCIPGQNDKKSYGNDHGFHPLHIAQCHEIFYYPSWLF
jgi:hypothetical protein